MIAEIFLFFIFIKLFLVYTNSWCKSKVCLVGKTALITGGNSGLGLETAKSLASRGCKVIIADKDDARYTAIALQKETHNQNVTSIQVDLSSFESVRNFAKTIISTVDRIDILINAASISSATNHELTKDGLPMIMQVNYFSHFLLVHLLAGLLIKSAPSRILESSSVLAHLLPSFTINDLRSQKSQNSTIWTYAKSKICVAITSKMFADKFRDTDVTCNCYCPGLIQKNFAEKAYKAGVFVSDTIFGFLVLGNIFGKTTEEGCQPILRLAIADEVRNITGQFFWETSEFPQPAQLKNEEFCMELWSFSEEVVGLKPEEKLDIILGNVNMKN